MAILAGAGFTAEELGRWSLRLSFRSWVERMRTPEPTAVQIRALFDHAPASAREALAIEADGTFTSAVALLKGEKVMG